MKKNLNIGLFGFGCVGQGLYNVLNQTHGIKATIHKICVKNREKVRPISTTHFTYHKEDILDNPEIDIVVELIDNADDAYVIVKEALQKGKAVVTANKKMLAEHFEEIVALQQQYQKPILYEASSCGSIPIIRNLEEYYDNDLLTHLQGIFNGTTNYILTKMYNEGKSYAEVLKEAQSLGFAESNPTLDVDAFDPKFKLCILAAHAFGAFLKHEEVFNYGIRTINPHDVQYAKEKGYKIRLVANVQKKDTTLNAWVIPQFVEKSHPLYDVENEFNAVNIQGAFSEGQFFKGKGAGGFPTASAVLSDISALTYQYQYEYKKRQQNVSLSFSNEHFVKVYVRYQKIEDIEKIKFNHVEQRFSSANFNFIVGEVSIQNLKEQEIQVNPNVFIAVMPS